MAWLEWRSFLKRLHWVQGEHVTILGPTGSGKTTLLLQLIKKRENVVLLLNKYKDRVTEAYLKANDYEDIQRWPPSRFADKVALWPRFTGIESFKHQSEVFRDAISGSGKGNKGIFVEGGWTVVIDEVLYLTHELHLEPELRMLWTQGRSNDLSVVAGSQRPRDIPQLMLSQATHYFLFHVTDRYEVQRISEVLGNASAVIREMLPRLKRHEFLYVNKETGKYIQSIVTK